MIMKKLLFVPAMIAVAVFFSGCESATGEYAGIYEKNQKETNFLGIYKHTKGGYKHVGPTTIDVSTEELYSDNTISGDTTELLFGLITIKDY